jgi:hypothetical protein
MPRSAALLDRRDMLASTPIRRTIRPAARAQQSIATTVNNPMNSRRHCHLRVKTGIVAI